MTFNPKVRLEFHGSTITSDAGQLLFESLIDALGLTEIAEDYLQAALRNILHHLVPLLRQSIFSRLAGYDDTNDADRLARPRHASSRGMAQMGRFETETLTEEKNLKGLARMNSQWVEGAMVHTPHRASSESPVHGHLYLSFCSTSGIVKLAKLRSGYVHSADDWQEVLDPVVERCQAVRLPRRYTNTWKRSIVCHQAEVGGSPNLMQQA